MNYLKYELLIHVIQAHSAPMRNQHHTEESGAAPTFRVRIEEKNNGSSDWHQNLSRPPGNECDLRTDLGTAYADVYTLDCR